MNTLPALTSTATGVATSQNAIALLTPLPVSPVQPVSDLRRYLSARLPVRHYRDEQRLWQRLPAHVADEVSALLTAFALVEAHLGPKRDRMSVTAACDLSLRSFRKWNWSFKRFRARYDAWRKSGDWFVLVNRSKAGADFQEERETLPEAFLQYFEQRVRQFARADGKRQAIFSLHRQWQTGRNPKGVAEAIPGYELGWAERDPATLPAGWHYSTLMRVLKSRGRFTRAVQAFSHEGESAARAHLPQILSTRAALRFMERIEFDDLRVDCLILNPLTGKAEELWLLVARDVATAMLLGFVMHPATIREDGRATHLGARHMKQLAGWMLERYPLPDYIVTWVLERGTAGLDEAIRAALGELLGHRIKFSVTSMIGGTSPVGYAEKSKGNSRGKARLESQNRLTHTMLSYLPGQTGNNWGVRPSDLVARANEAEEIWTLSRHLPEHIRARFATPILTTSQARDTLFRVFSAQNARTNHALEGFEEVVDTAGDRLVKRLESPIERAARLARGHTWSPVSPHIVRAFYEHTERKAEVQTNGELRITVEGKPLTFAHGGIPLVPGTKVLCYFHPDDPKFLHLTDGRGAMLGSWVRRERVDYSDPEALAEAMRYTHAAREAAREAAQILSAPERTDLEAMRAHNAELIRLNEFTEVTEAPAVDNGIVGAPAGAGLVSITAARQSGSRDKERRAETTASRLSLLRRAMAEAEAE